MKTEQLIVQYLYINKKVSLEDIGTFVLSPEINISVDNDKDAALPDGVIQYVYDSKAPADDGLIQYIIEHTGKMKPLASADLESFIMLNKQLLNIGKPLIIEGLGSLQKTQAGDFAFTQAGLSHVIQHETIKPITEKKKEKINFVTPPREKSHDSGKLILIIVLILIIAGFGMGIYYFINKSIKEKEEKALTESAAADSLNMINDDISPSAKQPGSTRIKNVKDSNSFYIVINRFPNLAAADKRVKKLQSFGNKVAVNTQDSVTYKVRMPFMSPLSDTLRVKDSLAKFFNTKTSVELP